MKTKINTLSSYIVIVTNKLDETRKFYTELFDFAVVFETDWYVQLLSKNGNQLGIMLPNLENQPEFLRNSYNGQGVILTLEVANVSSVYDDLKDKKVVFALPLKKEEWGQTHFIIQDPAGMHVDVVEKTSPEDYS